MRAYLGTTLEGLRAFAASGTAPGGPLRGVTPDLRAAAPGADDEELEFLATAAAADDSLALLAADGSGPWRRVVVALELPSARAGEGTEVIAAAAPGWRDAASILVDAPEAGPDLRRAAAGEPDLADDHELLWYGLQEIDRIDA